MFKKTVQIPQKELPVLRLSFKPLKMIILGELQQQKNPTKILGVFDPMGQTRRPKNNSLSMSCQLAIFFPPKRKRRISSTSERETVSKINKKHNQTSNKLS